MFGIPKRPRKRPARRDGGRLPAPGDGGILRGLGRPTVLRRLGWVLTTAIAVTALIASVSPPLPYRAGEISAHDLRVRTPFEVVNPPRAEWLREEEALQPPTSLPPALPPAIERYPLGYPMVRRGQPITEGQLVLLHTEHRAFHRSLPAADRVRRAGALLAVVLLLAFVLVLYVARFQVNLCDSLPKITRLCGLVVVTLAVGLALSRPPWHALLVPMTVTAMVLTIAYNPPFALLMSFSLSVVTTLALDADLSYLLVQMAALATAVLLLQDVRTRTKLVRVAAGAGLACLAMSAATGVLAGQGAKLVAADAGRQFAWCVLGGFILSGSLPLLERGFGLVTDVSLLELADGNHPLLRELIRCAPGTYVHSMTVATLAEAAAEAIGANPLLTRVGCHFHDVGKLLKPHYFIENQTGPNLHDDLEPALSTLVILGHVKDGLALAAQYRLPRPVCDFIEQHHGTTLVEYFYREALRLQEETGTSTHGLESAFRYPGPKPQMRESAVVMLADAVESSSRALTAPTPGSLRKLIRDLVMKRLLDGQFEESGLTLTELHRIEESLCKSLIALFHARIKYPEACYRERA